MDDMNAFERQVQRRVHRFVGPARPVDDLAIFEAVTFASRPPRWGFTIVSALKFVAAGVIVALFGGFLLAGLLTTPRRDGTVPAAVTESRSPMTTDELLAGMVTEEVEPGILRVVNDGVRDLALIRDDLLFGLELNLVAGLDGSVWLFLPDRFFRFGDEDQAAPGWELHRQDADIEITPDGHVLAVALREDGSADLVAFTDRLPPAENIWGDPSWPEYADRHYLDVAVQPDGTVHTAWFDIDLSGVPDDTSITVGTFWGGWVPLPPLAVEPDPDENGWWLEASGDPSGDGLWLVQPHGAIYRYTSWKWQRQDCPFDPDVCGARRFDVGPDGTAWMQADQDRIQTGEMCELRLARFDGTAWEQWGPEDGVPAVGPVFWYGGCNGGVSAVAPDGSIWLAAPDPLVGRDCSGIANFDGSTWTHYLDDLCVYDAAVTHDGAVWLLAGEVGYGEPLTWGPRDEWSDPSLDPVVGPIHAYVITPEATATTE